MEQITTISFFRHTGLKDKWWGFKTIGFGHRYLKKVNGLSFYKLMGSGKDFLLPDLSVSCLLQVWETEADADAFFKDSELMKQYPARTEEIWTIYMKNTSSRGEWSKQTPFEVHSNIDKNNTFLCAITRATIKARYLYHFWSHVPAARKPIHKDTKGMVFSKGIGEVPIFQMATFSIWESPQDLRAYSHGEGHYEAIQIVQKTGCFKESLFARFQPYKTVGNWSGVVPFAF